MKKTTRLWHAHHDLVRLLGADYLDAMVYPHIVKDATKTVLPYVLELDGSCTVLLRDSDSAMSTAQPATPHRFAVYGGYFSWNERPAAPALPQLIDELAPGRAVEVDDTLPVASYRALHGSLDLDVTYRTLTDRTLRHLTLERPQVAAAMESDVERYRRAARRVVEGFRFEERLAELLQRQPEHDFALLDAQLERAGVDALLVTSPFQMEELSGHPSAWLERAGAVMLFVRGDERLHLLLPGRGQLPGTVERSTYRDVGSAVAAIAPGTLAVEPGHADLGLARALDADPLLLPSASPLLYRWQELRAASQLPYYVLAANSARVATERTVKYAAGRLARGGELRESELALAFDAFLGEFAGECDLHGMFRPYFRIIHPGERTLVPAAPTPNLVSGRNRTVKFDMGTQILDLAGRVRGCSDIAKTLCNSPELEEFQALLRATLLDRVIPAIRPGVSGAVVHEAATEALAEQDDRVRGWDLLPHGRSGKEYARDCGHVINRQTICTIYLEPGCEQQIEAGMSGCVEFVWPVDEAVVAIEDAYLVTESGAIPITA